VRRPLVEWVSSQGSVVRRPDGSSKVLGVVTEATAVPDGARRLRLLQLVALTSTIDRFAIAPLLVLIAADLHVSLAAAAGMAGAYFLAYGVMQPVWGMVSDRLGRVRVMRVALVGAAIAGVVSALAPTLPLLTVARVITGGFVAALIPASLVYVGDTWPAAIRQRPLSDVLAASALGTATATAGAGVLADLVGWRIVFAVTAAVGAVLWFALRRLPEPTLPAQEPGGSGYGGGVGVLGRVGGWLLELVRPLGTVLADRWARIVMLLALVEGAIVLGTLTYLSPALQALGYSATVAGVVSGAYGVGTVLVSRVVRPLVGRIPPSGLAAIGGACLVAGWAVPSFGVSLPTILVAGLLLGATWAFLHSTLQTWATEVVPAARASAVALFAGVLFLGSAIGTGVAAPFADGGEFETVFRAALAISVPLVVAAVLARRGYARARES
jgi:MFS family permease